jgi:hypothetical protein
LIVKYIVDQKKTRKMKTPIIMSIAVLVLGVGCATKSARSESAPTANVEDKKPALEDKYCGTYEHIGRDGRGTRLVLSRRGMARFYYHQKGNYVLVNGKRMKSWRPLLGFQKVAIRRFEWRLKNGEIHVTLEGQGRNGFDADIHVWRIEPSGDLTHYADILLFGGGIRKLEFERTLKKEKQKPK